MTTQDFGLIETVLSTSASYRQLEAFCLSSRSAQALALLTYRASRGKLLRHTDLWREPHDVEVRALGHLMRAVALQDESHASLAEALRLVQTVPAGLLDAEHRFFLAQLKLVTGDLRQAEELTSGLSSDPRNHELQGLRTDLLHPADAGQKSDAWWSSFTKFFTDSGLQAPALNAKLSGCFFDQLVSPNPSATVDGPIVTVVMTTFRPGRSLLTSVHSILAQTWTSLEVILVDDASGSAYAEILDEVQSLDPRVKVLRNDRNRGTYACRNQALDIATGQFVTGQDDDDWSHPQRIEQQVAPLLGKEATATRVLAIRAQENLWLTRPGAQVFGLFSSSYMARLDTLRQAGGFLPARKGADAELSRRVETLTGQAVVTVDSPLALYRLTAGSLSRAEFGAGWHHPVRAAFWSAAAYVHNSFEPGARPTNSQLQQIRIPYRYSENQPPRHIDIVFVADWSAPEGVVRGYVDAIHQALAQQQRVAVLRLPNPTVTLTANNDKNPRQTVSQIQHLINTATVDEVFLDDDLQVQTLVVLDPAAVQFAPLKYQQSSDRLKAVRTFVLAQEQPADATLTTVSYVPAEVASNIRELFSASPTWVTDDELVAAHLQAAVPGTVHPSLLPLLKVQTGPGNDANLYRRSTVGLVTSTAPNQDEFRQVLQHLQNATNLEIRILGTPTAIANQIGVHNFPGHWVVFADNDLDLDLFLQQIDFYLDLGVHGSHPDQVRSQAVAAGCLPLTPATLPPSLGPDVTYTHPKEIPAAVANYLKDQELATTTASAGQRLAETNPSTPLAPWLLTP